MKITDMELFLIEPRWLFLKISTDEGIAGWGEPVLEGRAATTKAAVEELKSYLIGKNPLKIEDHFQVLYRGGFYRGGPVLMSALSGIEQALWDIKGKYFKAPVYELLGGAVRDKVKVYGWIGGDRPSEADLSSQAKKQIQSGYQAVKMNATEQLNYIDSYKKIDQVLKRVQTVREAVGPDICIALDFHGRVHKTMAKILVKELEPFRLMFIEEPVLPEHQEALREIARMTTIPIATGERMYTRWGFKELLQQGYVDIIQPDLSHAGGIFETRKISAMAEAYDIAVAPHCPLGPIALASCFQHNICTPNFVIQEQSLGIHYNAGVDLLDYLKNPEVFSYQTGFVELPTAPGLGIEVNEEKVREAAKKGHDWHAPIWRHEDGSYAEW
ncbi:D-galactonate dehydratase [Paenibacillus sp. oral taxon 786 str. D14]|uniref:galactonate dehydratase n=1 Tax=Paenibacillus sp. oral taxon 786 TaxID=652715 RepID=UPI0001AFDCFC|nr:galactonate dehydratase [Paenibacillus sp. oral taxon 786]EES72364.1 D-galactonate dehydratase [Paenibacillus sp. oral taxon 786 str. D14]